MGVVPGRDWSLMAGEEFILHLNLTSGILDMIPANLRTVEGYLGAAFLSLLLPPVQVTPPLQQNAASASFPLSDSAGLLSSLFNAIPLNLSS